jgi:hypothetical protein
MAVGDRGMRNRRFSESARVMCESDAQARLCERENDQLDGYISIAKRVYERKHYGTMQGQRKSTQRLKNLPSHSSAAKRKTATTARRALHVPELSRRILSSTRSPSSWDEPHAVGILNAFVVDAAVSLLVTGACTLDLNTGSVLGRRIR